MFYGVQAVLATWDLLRAFAWIVGSFEIPTFRKAAAGPVGVQLPAVKSVEDGTQLLPDCMTLEAPPPALPVNLDGTLMFKQ